MTLTFNIWARPKPARKDKLTGRSHRIYSYVLKLMLKEVPGKKFEADADQRILWNAEDR